MQERERCRNEVLSRRDGMSMNHSLFITKEKAKRLNPKARGLADLVGKVQDDLCELV